MKKLLSWLIVATLMFALPSISMAKAKGKGKGSKSEHVVAGKVTAVSGTTMTIEVGDKAGKKAGGKKAGGKKKGGKSGGNTKTISVPAGTPIKQKGGSTPSLDGLVGKKVKVKENAGTATEISVDGGKDKKGKAKKSKKK